MNNFVSNSTTESPEGQQGTEVRENGKERMRERENERESQRIRNSEIRIPVCLLVARGRVINALMFKVETR